MLICRKAARVHGQKKVWNPCPKSSQTRSIQVAALLILDKIFICKLFSKEICEKGRKKRMYLHKYSLVTIVVKRIASWDVQFGWSRARFWKTYAYVVIVVFLFGSLRLLCYY